MRHKIKKKNKFKFSRGNQAFRERVKAELVLRDWRLINLSEASGIPLKELQKLLDGTLIITEQHINGLCRAFGQPKEFWFKLSGLIE